MSASDRTITRALSDLSFAVKDLKDARSMDAVQRKFLTDEAVRRVESALASLKAEG